MVFFFFFFFCENGHSFLILFNHLKTHIDIHGASRSIHFVSVDFTERGWLYVNLTQKWSVTEIDSSPVEISTSPNIPFREMLLNFSFGRKKQ